MDKKLKPLCGIDYGSKLAGTTVLAKLTIDTGKVEIFVSQKKKDADAFLQDILLDIKPVYVFIDAPLSLPKIYVLSPEDRLNIVHPDYFYRKGDRLLNAMSPLFLGGLTARAMRLVHQLQSIIFYETYPAWQAKKLELKALHYKKEVRYISEIQTFIESKYPQWNIPTLNSWHEIDAVLALIGAERFSKNEHEVFGDEEEGAIYV